MSLAEVWRRLTRRLCAGPGGLHESRHHGCLGLWALRGRRGSAGVSRMGPECGTPGPGGSAFASWLRCWLSSWALAWTTRGAGTERQDNRGFPSGERDMGLGWDAAHNQEQVTETSCASVSTFYRVGPPVLAPRHPTNKCWARAHSPFLCPMELPPLSVGNEGSVGVGRGVLGLCSAVSPRWWPGRTKGQPCQASTASHPPAGLAAALPLFLPLEVGQAGSWQWGQVPSSPEALGLGR